MKIILDAMGGDNAPQAIVQGAVDAAKTFDAELVLDGRETDDSWSPASSRVVLNIDMILLL